MVPSRDYTGIAPSTLPNPESGDFRIRLIEKLTDVDYFLRDLSRGAARIQQGQVPDGSGVGIPVDPNSGVFDNYWDKRGISSPFTAYMQNVSGGSGIISSTAHATKGKMHFGVSGSERMTIDETAGAVGINTTAPAATLHIVGNSAAGSVLTTTSDIAPQWAPDPTHYYTSLAGATTLGSHFTALAADDGASSFVALQTTPGDGTNPEKIGLSGTVTPGRTYTVTAKVFTLSGTLPGGSIIYLSVVDSSGNVWRDSTGQSTAGIGTTATSVTATILASGTPYATGETGNAVWLDASSGASYTCVTYVTVQSNAGDIARWDLNGGTRSGQIDSLGQVGINTGSSALSGWLTVKASAETDTLATFYNSAGSGRVRFQGVSGGGMDSHYYASGGDGVVIRSPTAGTTGRIGVNVSGTPAASVHVYAENGAADGVLIWPFSSTSGPSLRITSPGGAASVWSMADGFLTHRTYTGQGSGTLMTLQNSLGNAATALIVLTPHASQSGNAIEYGTTRFVVASTGQTTIIPSTAAVSLILQRHASGTATDIMRVQNSSGNIVGKFSAGGRLSLDPAGTTTGTLSTTGILNVSMNSLLTPAIISSFTIDANAAATGGFWRLVTTVTDTAVGGNDITCFRVAPTFSTGGTSRAIHSEMTIADDSTGSGIFRAMDFSISVTSSNPISTIGGAVGSIDLTGSTANISVINAISAVGSFDGSGTVTELNMIKVTGNINSGTFGDAFGIYLDVGGNATVTGEVKGIHIFDISHDGVTDTACWCLHLESAAQNWLRGNLGIGTQATVEVPTAKLHTSAGSTSAGSSAFKQTAGSLMTTPEAGAEEYDGDYFYKTNGGSRGAVCLASNVLVDGSGNVLTAGGEVLLAA